MRILITGSASGLGKALAKALLDLGHEVIPYDIDHDVRDDVTNPEGASLDEVSRLDVLVNCAGINSNEWFEDVTRESFDKIMHTNAYAIVGMTQALLPQLIASRGTVINIVSNASHIPMTCSLAYNASKAAAAMISRQMAHELTPKHGITVFSISPNKLAGTGMSKQIEENVMRTRGWSAEFAAEYQRKALMHGRETDPEALAGFIANLIDTNAMQYLSGCDIPFGK
ncbi:short-chain dehydrogenase/reductase [Luteibacter phage vB_LflM-Pluto]|uniref:Short-chain dehydrogenase/reductase n=1 Tax=Luteibacter phage vB_LflM-Pluto TaxID=2948611 RepID=A0A9E7MUK6_9CAUD|nr:short-chain dehydrogenase/reductase [Luteibacter phage vB_LflM-Pluto]